MRHFKDVLRLRFEAKLSQRQIARSLGISLGTVSEYLKRTRKAGIGWPLPSELGDHELERQLFPLSAPQHRLVPPDFTAIHKELRSPGVTKQLLWEEYKQVHGDQGYQYTQFCYHYKQWVNQLKRSMRQVHKAGEKCFIDYCGPTLPIIDSRTGEVRQAQVFVAVLGASSYTYAEATWSQKVRDWVTSHVNMFKYFDGVPEILVPDNLKSAVIKACRYEPTTNTSYQHLAQHYDTAIIPTRPYKPYAEYRIMRSDSPS